VLTRVFELSDEVQVFLTLQEHELAESVSDDEWVAKLAHLSDIFVHLNELNRKMQGKSENILTSVEKIQGFHKKLKLWLQHIATGNLEIFPTVCSLAVHKMFVPAIEEHIKILQQKFCDYFDTDIEHLDWVLNPFAIITPFLPLKAEELTDLKANRTLNFKFSELLLDSFWIAVREQYPTAAERAIKILLPFSTTYMCELGFLTLTAIKAAKKGTTVECRC
jgi:hypothetical protein